MLRPAALLALVSVLAACGGGESGRSVTVTTTTTPSTPRPAQPQDALLTVSATSAPGYDAADCPRFEDTAAAAAALDLADPDIRVVDQYLKSLDPVHAYGVFVRRPYDFVNWLAASGGTIDLVSLPGAVHETAHMVGNVLKLCAPAGTYKALFMGEILATHLKLGDLPSVKVVDTVIDPALKSHFRYDTYITQAAPDNDFTILLDEFAAYTGAAHTELRMLQDGRFLTAGGDAQMGGLVTMMVFVENYLMAVRRDDPAAWNLIKEDAATVAALQAIWRGGEQTLRDGFAFTQPGGVVRMSVDAAYFAAAYSPGLLAELDAIGVSHAAASAWSGTYLP